jgi:D-glycero-D-manno-heptose 1,7-bisphosphate phosphatase
MRAVFLDRDGVLIESAPAGEYVAKWEEVRFLPGAVSSVATLYKAGFKIVIVTNQRGVALRKVQPEHLADIHNRITAKFAECGVTIAGIYFCPHDTWERCLCRKPAPGMLLRAAEDHMLDLRHCWMVGDAPSDIEAGKQAGCKTILIKTATARKKDEANADLVADDLQSAADQIRQSVQATLTRFL